MSTSTQSAGRPSERGGAPWGIVAAVALLIAVVGAGLFLVLGLPGSGMGDVSAGQALFEGNCVECHGEGALGDGPMAGSLPVPPPSLLEHLAHHTRAQLVGLIRTGVPPAMPPAALTDEEVGQVIDYVWTLVPESEVAALRAMQEQMEMMGGGAMPPMNMPEPEPEPEADHSEH